MAKLYVIPEEVRDETYEEDGVVEDGDYGKCGGCNWEASTVYMMASSQEDANEAFRENHRGLCGECMCELLVEERYDILKEVHDGSLPGV